MIWRSDINQKAAQFADILTIFLSIISSYYIWFYIKHLYPHLGIGLDFKVEREDAFLIILILLVWFFFLHKQGAYSYQRFTSFSTELKIIFNSSLYGILIILSIIFIFRWDYIPRSLIALFLFVNTISLVCEKYLLFYAAKMIRAKGLNRKRVLIVGSGRNSKKVIGVIKERLNWGLDIVGYLREDGNDNDLLAEELECLGTFADIKQVLHSIQIDEVIVAISAKRMSSLVDILKICEIEGVQTRIISDFLGKFSKNIRADVVYDLPIISIYTTTDDWRLLVKLVFDFVVATTLLIILSPLILVITILIKISSPGPVFYAWKVIGLNKKAFTGYKFRSMIEQADSLKSTLLQENEMSGPVFKITDDPRITKIGRILRKYSLDELPQLLSVIKGDMSLVGPRPPLESEFDEFDSWHRRKLSVKPGLTCLWQINGRSDITEFNTWAKLDLEYIDNWSLFLDFKILLKTIPVVLFGKGAK